MPKLIGQGGRDVLGRLIEALIALLGHAGLPLCSILLHLCPERFVGGPDLAGDGARHLRGHLVASAYLIVGAILQTDLVTHFAMRKGVLAHVVQGITIGQLGPAQGGELCSMSMQFQLGSHGYFHHLSVITYLMKVVKRQRYPGAPAPNKVGPFLPRMNAGGILGRFCDLPETKQPPVVIVR